MRERWSPRRTRLLALTGAVILAGVVIATVVFFRPAPPPAPMVAPTIDAELLRDVAWFLGSDYETIAASVPANADLSEVRAALREGRMTMAHLPIRARNRAVAIRA